MISEKLHGAISGREVGDCWGNTKKIDLQMIKTKRVLRVFSQGKRLYIDFGNFLLSIHFLMYGSYTINVLKERPVRLCLDFGDNRVYFYNVSLDIVSGDEISHGDILSEGWSLEEVLAGVKNNKDLICDLLLDQNLFPGVGNIIKVEALYRAGINPYSRTDKLTEDELRRLFEEVRRFSLLFYDLRKQGKRLKDHLLIYRKRRCPNCKSPLIYHRGGKRNRLNIFCEVCQSGGPEPFSG